ncbi:MAG: PadR family transcriptional regulator [Actinomycetota bacterium]|nr:PadR family transcriptional regulator [Actinomycetota bacterium]
MPTRPARSNTLALAVLTCLLEKPMHPYEVAQTLRFRAKHESIRLNYGSLYGVVESLEKRGLIRATGTVRAGRRPERTTYEITDPGLREMADWLSELVAVPVKEYLQFEAALSLLPALPPDEALDCLGQRATKLEMDVAMLEGARAATAHELPRLFVLETEYVSALHQAELTYVRGLMKDIESGQLSGLEEWRSWYAPGGERAEADPDSPAAALDPDPDPDPASR